MMREVLTAENSAVEAKEMNAIHAMSGNQRLRNLASDCLGINIEMSDMIQLDVM